MPVAEDIPKLYSSYYTHTDASHLPAWLLRIMKDVEASIWASAFEYDTSPQMSVFKALRPVLSRFRSLRERAARMVMWLKASQRGRLLDVGCGSGLFMREMLNLGWDVIGVEPDYRAAYIAKEKFGLDVYQSNLEQAGFADCTFDAITMNNVLEHLTDPLRAIAECRRILKLKGRLVLLTPNAASLGHKYFQRDWRGLEPPRHLFLFTPNNIRHAIENTGLYVEHVKTVVQGAGSILARSHELRHFRLFKGCVRDSQAKGLGQQSRPLVKCLLYQLWESLAILTNPQIGEEILVIATKQRSVD
jgi:SAM-dependent methyltransferase